ncbi:hypothetical protein HID58_070198 [Brassica napus]|uniref:Uncharacterized protein n=1 Tax=Brassica napus TaxID=3708 RepID=A0ABQ7YY41_BRANA|nr:hypothetical protein HID58_070198 [Brassica napus]
MDLHHHGVGEAFNGGFIAGDEKNDVANDAVAFFFVPASEPRYLCNNNKAESCSSSILLLFDLSRFRSNPPTASSQSGTGFITVALDVEIVPPENSVLNTAAERFFKSEIRRRLFVTSVLLVLSRVGYLIPLPGFDRRLIPQDYLSFVSGSVVEGIVVACTSLQYSVFVATAQ